MAAFVPCTSFSPSSFCPPHVCRRGLRVTSKHAQVNMRAEQTFGGDNPAYGFVMPELNEADKAYVDGAKTDKEFMQRMAQVARRIDMDRQRESKMIGRQSPDDYLEGLKRADLMKEVNEGRTVEEAEKGDLRDLGAEEYGRQVQREREKLLEREQAQNFKMDKNELDRKMKEWEQGLREMAPDENISVDEQAIERQIRQVQKELRDIGGISEDDLEPEHHQQSSGEEKLVDEHDIEEQIKAVEQELRGITEEAEGAKEEKEVVDNVDRQIEFLQKHLDKLKREEEEEEEAAKQSSGEPVIEGLEDTPGEMSAEEKMAAFAAIRRQAMQRSGEEFADPLAKPLPTKAVEQRQSEEEDEQFDDLLELEAEIKRYLFEAKDSLQKHEENILRIVNRLKKT